MINYTKPTVISSNDLAEGVYAASGSANGNIKVEFVSEENWSTPASGMKKYKFTVPAEFMNQNKNIRITVKLGGSHVEDAWIDGANKNISGDTAVLDYYNPTNPVMYFNVKGDDASRKVLFANASM